MCHGARIRTSTLYPLTKHCRVGCLFPVLPSKRSGKVEMLCGFCFTSFTEYQVQLSYRIIVYESGMKSSDPLVQGHWDSWIRASWVGSASILIAHQGNFNYRCTMYCTTKLTCITSFQTQIWKEIYHHVPSDFSDIRRFLSNLIPFSQPSVWHFSALFYSLIRAIIESEM